MKNSNMATDLPMKWHKFLIYFSLWAGAILLAVNGGQLLTGSEYGNDAEAVYLYYPGLKGVDMTFGILLLALAVFMIYTRFQLAHFKEGAPNKLTMVYVLEIVSFLGYSIAVASVAKLPISDIISSQTTSSIVSSVVMIIANRTYYNKRAHLFGNASAVSNAGFEAASYSAPIYTPASAPSGKFCPKCGTRVEADDTFCVNCGTKLR